MSLVKELSNESCKKMQEVQHHPRTIPANASQSVSVSRDFWSVWLCIGLSWLQLFASFQVASLPFESIPAIQVVHFQKWWYSIWISLNVTDHCEHFNITALSMWTRSKSHGSHGLASAKPPDTDQASRSKCYTVHNSCRMFKSLLGFYMFYFINIIYIYYAYIYIYYVYIYIMHIYIYYVYIYIMHVYIYIYYACIYILCMYIYILCTYIYICIYIHTYSVYDVYIYILCRYIMYIYILCIYIMYIYILCVHINIMCTYKYYVYI